MPKQPDEDLYEGEPDDVPFHVDGRQDDFDSPEVDE